jgi:hypothetical protein
MLSVKENFLETIKLDGKPDCLVNGYEFMELLRPDPLLRATAHGLKEGERGKDGFGVVYEWTVGQPAAAPLPHADAIVVKDISKWEETLRLPGLENHDWTDTKMRADEIRKSDKFLAVFHPGGLFERLHFLMGFEGALVSLMIDKDEMSAMIQAIGAHRMRYAELLVENLRPEIYFLHDDWGMKHSLFVDPEVWREMIRPHYEELFLYLRSEGLIIIHHADSFLEPIVGDMADMGVDVWQGVLPQNDIVKLQTELSGRMTLMGGIDAAIVDTPTVTEEEIRMETHRACVTYGIGGHFIPSFTNGLPGEMLFKGGAAIITDEVTRYNKEIFEV